MTSKRDFYFAILELLSNGKTPSEIIKILNISKQRIHYYTQKLQELGFIRKEKTIWIVINSKKADLEHTINMKNKQIRGHAFIWIVKTEIKYDWKMLLEKKKINYNLVRGYTPRTFINKKKVWFGKETIVIYETKSFYGKNATESRKYAVFELQKTMERLFNKLGILSKYYFKPSREHYGMIKNELARQYNKNGERIIVKDDLDGDWLWIDFSHSVDELETGGKGFTKDRTELNREVQNWYNDMKKTDFKVTPTFLLETINSVVQNQVIFDKNIVKHQEVLEEMSQTLKKIREGLDAKTKSN